MQEAVHKAQPLFIHDSAPEHPLPMALHILQRGETGIPPYIHIGHTAIHDKLPGKQESGPHDFHTAIPLAEAEILRQISHIFSF